MAVHVQFFLHFGGHLEFLKSDVVHLKCSLIESL